MQVHLLRRVASAALIVASTAVSLNAANPVDVEVLDATPGSTVVRVTLGDFDLVPVDISGDAWTKVALHGEGSWNVIGLPSLPHVCRSIEIPDQARMDVRVVSSRYHDIEGVLVLPARGAIPRTVDPGSVPYTFDPIYDRDEWFPADPATQRSPYILRDRRGMVIEANVFQYNPARRTLRVHDELVLEAVAVGAGGENPLVRAGQPDRTDAVFSQMYRSHFLNPTAGAEAGAGDVGSMLIISHGPFVPDMQPLIDWKTSLGMQVEIVDVATIGNDPATIAEFISRRYAVSDLAYVLLVGDKAEVATPTYSGGESDPTYAVITPDWYPDLLVGRFSAQTSAHVQTQVERTVEYEQAQHELWMGGWHDDGMGIASNQGTGHYGEYDDEHMDLIRNQLFDYGFQTVDRIYDYFGTKAMIKAGLEEGRRAIHYCGHGSSSSWGTTGFSVNDIKALQNDNLLPIIHSVACVNGDFGKDECFAEAWLRSTHAGEPIGAVATYMSSINQYWDEPMYAQATHGNGGNFGTVDLFACEGLWSVAGLWFAGSNTMMDLTGNWGRDMFMTWHVFGDPSLRVMGDWSVQTLFADTWSIPIDTPVDVHFTLTPGAAYASEAYILLGSITGTVPGTTLPDGLFAPINMDLFTDVIFKDPVNPPFADFFGILDGSGTATPTLSTGPFVPFSPGFVGKSLHFTGVVWTAGFDFVHATNPKMLTLTL